MNVSRPAAICYRIVDRGWDDPLDGRYAMRYGQRFTRQWAYPTLYFHADIETALATVVARLAALEALGVTVEDLDPGELPGILPCHVPDRTVLDLVSDEGIADVQLPATFPRESSGQPLAQLRCHPYGQQAFNAGLDGVEYRSLAWPTGVELAWFTDPPRPDPGTHDRRIRPAGPVRWVGRELALPV